jgi:hypothetical protein
MVTKHFEDVYQIAHDLAEGFSTQSKFSNKVWLALIAAATLVLFPDIDASSGNVKLPFSLGSVGPGTYKVVGFLILTVLIISYCQTYAATHIAVRIAHDLIDKIEPESKRLDVRSFFGLLVTPNLARVSPLAQLTGLSRLAAVYYFFLKLLAITVLFVIPLIAAFFAYNQLASSLTVGKWICLISFFVLCITSTAVLQLLYTELCHTFRVAKKYWTGELSGSSNRSNRSPDKRSAIRD